MIKILWNCFVIDVIRDVFNGQRGIYGIHTEGEITV